MSNQKIRLNSPPNSGRCGRGKACLKPRSIHVNIRFTISINMPRCCAVPNCTTNYRQTRSTFKVPRDPELFEQWITAIPGITYLQSNQRVCEKHFKETAIIRKYMKHDSSGRIIAQCLFKRPRLDPSAVPTEFDVNFVNSDEQVLERTDADASHVTNVQSEQIIDDTAVKSEENAQFNDSTQPTVHTKDTDITEECTEDMRYNKLGTSTPENPWSPQNDIENNITEDCTEDVLSNSTTSTITFDSVSFDFSVKCENLHAEKDSLALPKPWNVCRCTAGGKPALLFTYVVNITQGETESHIFEKAVIVNTCRELQYQVHSLPVNAQEAKLPKYLDNVSSLPDILKKFKGMRICDGIAVVDFDSAIPKGALNYAGTGWHSKDCALLTRNKKRCTVCNNYTRAFVARIQRMKRKKKIIRISSTWNPVDQMKLKAAQKKIKERSQRAYQLKRRLDLLTTYSTQQQNAVAHVTDAGLQIKCSSMKISDNQQMLIREIIQAARTNNARGIENKYIFEGCSKR